MLRFVARRLVWAIPTLLLVTFLVYVAIRIGTNPSEAYQRSNPRANAAKIAEYEELNNLNGSYVSGYFRWLGVCRASSTVARVGSGASSAVA